MFVNREHIFKGERFEVESVAGVVIGGNGLRITVHHDGFVSIFTKCERGMAATVIELNSLPDAVRSAAEDDDLLLGSGWSFVLIFVGGVHVRRVALELGGACIHKFINGTDAALFAPRRDSSGSSFARCGGWNQKSCDLRVTKSHAFGFANKFWRNAQESG